PPCKSNPSFTSFEIGFVVIPIVPANKTSRSYNAIMRPLTFIFLLPHPSVQHPLHILDVIYLCLSLCSLFHLRLLSYPTNLFSLERYQVRLDLNLIADSRHAVLQFAYMSYTQRVIF